MSKYPEPPQKLHSAPSFASERLLSASRLERLANFAKAFHRLHLNAASTSPSVTISIIGSSGDTSNPSAK